MPVLAREVLDVLVNNSTKSFFDGTLGLGGHASMILEKYPQVELYIGCDLDGEHADLATERLKSWKSKVRVYNHNFSNIETIVKQEDPARPLSVLLDLGICSHHIDNAEKGFSFQSDGPLSMVFDKEQERNAERFLNNASEKEIFRCLKQYGEEPKAFRITKNILKKREQGSLKTTNDLKECVEASVFPQERRKALTRVFQAIRMEVNDELKHLEKALEGAREVMQKNDIMGIMTYHSLEDRMVKKAFSAWVKPKTEANHYSLHAEVEPAQFELVTKKPLVPLEDEIEQNPRARSAKFRIIKKIV